MKKRTKWIRCALEARLSLKKNIIEFIANFISALIMIRSVNWVEIAQAMEGDALQESKYKMIQRYFRSMTIPEPVWADLILSLYPQAQYRLSMDRTNWKTGRKDVNYLVLAVIIKKTAIPVYWKVLPKKGNSTSGERIEIIKKFIKNHGAEKIDFLTADREFGSQEFVQYLLKHSIPFCIRVRNDCTISKENPKAIGLSAKVYLKRLKYGKKLVLQQCYIWGLPVSLVMRRERKDSVILITNFKPNCAMKLYRKRWKIEELFQNLKSRGFNLESTHVTHPPRLHKLLGLLTMAYVWCYFVGEQVHQEKPIAKKKHQRMAKSIFRAGLDLLRHVLICFSTNHNRFIQLVKSLREHLQTNKCIQIDYRQNCGFC